VNIIEGLHNSQNHKITKVEIYPNKNIQGQRNWSLQGTRGNCEVVQSKVVFVETRGRPRKN